MIRRLQYAMTGGINEMDVLAYMPTETMQLHHIPDQNYTHAFMRGALLQDDRAVYVDHELQLLFNAMLSANIDYDLIHRDAVENYEVRGQQIVNVLNGQRFSVLLLPMCEVLPLSMARLAEAFAAAGGRIVAVDEIPAIGVHETEDAEIREIMDRLRVSGSLDVIPAADKETILRRLDAAIPHPITITAGVNGTVNAHPSYPPYLIDPYVHTGEDMTGVQFVRYCKDGQRNTLFMNYSDHPETIEVHVVTGGSVPEVWDTLSGEITQAEVAAVEADGYTVRLALPCNHGVFLVSEL